jgi:hypothetical protein
MNPETRKHAGILIVIIPTVIYGGVSISRFLINDPAYMQINLAYVGAILLTTGLIALGIGLIRKNTG